jgi:hypothetical protein
MTGKIKALGLAFVAITAISAMAASGAQAGTFHIGANPAVITAHSAPNGAGGFQQHTFTVGPVVCDTATFEAQVGVGPEGTQSIHEATLTPTYSACKLAKTNATVQTNGCQYTLTGSGVGANKFNVDIVNCTSGKSIQIKTALCTVDVPGGQNNLSHVVATNIGGGPPNQEVSLNATVSGITALETGAACPNGNNAHTTTGVLSGTTIFKAFVDAGNTPVTKHVHSYNEQLLGAQVELIST